MTAGQAKQDRSIWQGLQSALPLPVFKRRKRQKVSIRTWLIDASSKALPSLASDVHLKELINSLRSIDLDSEKESFKRHAEINDHICRVILDYLKRVRIRTMIIRADTALDGAKLHCILTMESRGRTVTRYLELKA